VHRYQSYLKRENRRSLQHPYAPAHLMAGPGYRRQLIALDPDESTSEAIGDWHYGSDTLLLGESCIHALYRGGCYATACAREAKRCARLIPNRRILEIKVVRRRPSRAAAPFGPPITPLVRVRV